MLILISQRRKTKQFIANLGIKFMLLCHLNLTLHCYEANSETIERKVVISLIFIKQSFIDVFMSPKFDIKKQTVLSP